MLQLQHTHVIKNQQEEVSDKHNIYFNPHPPPRIIYWRADNDAETTAIYYKESETKWYDGSEGGQPTAFSTNDGTKSNSSMDVSAGDRILFRDFKQYVLYIFHHYFFFRIDVRALNSISAFFESTNCFSFFA